MPFPLAHPAAVLPLRGLCPKRLNFAALMIGSLTPDAGYCLQRFKLDTFSHTFVGSLGFCLPVGIALLAVFYFLRSPLVSALPSPHREALLPLCRRAPFRPWIVVLSLLIGAWTHIALDSLTRESDWLVHQLPVMQDDFTTIAGKGIKTYRVLWYGLTAAGLFLLGWTYLQFLRRANGSARIFSTREKGRYLFWAGVLVLPYVVIVPFAVEFQRNAASIHAVRYFILDSMPVYLVSTTVLLGLIGFGLKLIGRTDGAAGRTRGHGRIPGRRNPRRPER